jgi:hypothetical protein
VLSQPHERRPWQSVHFIGRAPPQRVDVSAVNVTARGVMAVKPRAARTTHHRVRFPHGVFPRGPIPLIAPLLKTRFRTLRQKNLPRRFKIGTGLIESLGGAAGMLARLTARIEPASPDLASR